MLTKVNKCGETTVMTKAAALAKAEHNARYRHGTWFAWMHKDGTWYATKLANPDVLDDAALNVDAGSKVYVVGGGSMTFSRLGSSIIRMWANNAAAGFLAV